MDYKYFISRYDDYKIKDVKEGYKYDDLKKDYKYSFEKGVKHEK